MTRLLAPLAFVVLLAPTGLHGQSVSSQSPETGLPFFNCTPALETGGSDQLWSIEQDERGIMYIGSIGISEYDGTSWRHIPNERHTSVRSLDSDGSGRIYVSGGNEFGYLVADSTGRSTYRSLLPFVPEEHQPFDEIWTVHSTPRGVYFMSREKLFLATPSGENWLIAAWDPEVRFLYAFVHNGTYYVHQQDVGLTRMVGDELVPVPGGQQFGSERLQVMLPDHLDPKGFILGTFNRGFFRFDGSSFSPWETEIDDFLRRNTLYKAAVLPDGTLALATLAGGLALLSPEGRLRGLLNIEAGLPGNDVLAVFADRSGLLWAAPQGSICRIDVSSPLSRFDASRGLDGSITDIIRHQGILYVTTQNAVQYLDPASGRLRHVRGFAQGVSQSWQLLSLGEDLLVSTGTGLYQIRRDRAISIIRNEGGVLYSPIVLHRSTQDPNRVFVGLLDGLASVYRDGPGRWRDEGRLDVPRFDVRTMIEPSPGVFWLGTFNSGAIRFNISRERTIVGEIEIYGEESGLIPTTGFVSEIGGVIIAGNVDQIDRFDETSKRFVSDSLLSTLVDRPLRGIADLVQDHRGIHYVTFGSGAAAVYLDDEGSLRIDRTPFLPFADTPSGAVYPDEDGTVWFGTNEDLIRFDPHIAKIYDADFPVLIRRVAASGDREVSIGGAGDNAIRIPYDENNLRLEFSAATYEKPSATVFQTKLEGFDEEWSEWTSDNRREYTNIPPRNYSFRVRARNVYGHMGHEAVLAFTILPPWYRTVWAYAFYIVLFAGAVFATDRLQRRRVLKKERERAAIENAELRVAAAEAQSKALEAENERKKNIELLSRIGRDITGTLSSEQIIETVYEHVNALMDASVFGIGLHNPEEHRLEFPATKERGETLPLFANDLDSDRLAVWCFKNRKEVVIQDLREEWSRYLDHFEPAIEGDDAASIIYLPLIHRDKPIGVITAQSFDMNAYTEDHLNILRNLATYTAIALDNADAYRRLNATVEELNDTLRELRTTQQQLVTQEKMASLGALTAGIAHEIKNPLNFVNNFSQLIVELTDELRDELAARSSRQIADVLDELDEIVLGLRSNARQIAKHGKRADDIVRGMMQHASGGSGERYEVAVNGLVDEYVQLAYHGFRARSDAPPPSVVKDLAPDAGTITMVPQEIGRVLINLLNNAFDAASSPRQNGQHEPLITVRTRRTGRGVQISVEDSGQGVPDAIRDRIFEPFFTTKPAGSGTGLGLSLSYDVVVHGHGGELLVENIEGSGARFSIVLPAQHVAA